MSPKDHKCSDGGGESSDEMSRFYCQLLGIHSNYLGSPTLSLMAS